MGYKPQERDIIEVSLEAAREFYEQLQRSLKGKFDFVSKSSSEIEDLKQGAQDYLSSNPGSLNYHSLESRVHLSWYYEKKGDFDQAIKVLEEVVNTAESSHKRLYHPALYAQLIYLYELRGEYKKASAAYESVAKYRPAVCLRMLPHNQVLVCGFSTHEPSFVNNFDEVSDLNGKRGGIHLGFLGRIRTQDIQNIRGEITEEQHVLLLEKLREYLKDPLREYLEMPDLYKISPRL